MATKPTISIRRTLPSDIPAIVDLERLANASHPIIALAFSKAKTPEEGQELGQRVFIQRYMWMLEHSDVYQSYSAIATLGGGKEEVIGFLVGTRPKRYQESGELEEGEDVEWQPVLPEGTNLPFFEYYLSTMMTDKAQYHVEKIWELECLAVSPDYQRLGIGSRLISDWLVEYVDAVEVPPENGNPKFEGLAGKGAYLRASAKGRGLYEKFGWRVKGSLKTRLTGWVEIGEEVKEKNTVDKEKLVYENWNMIRGPLGKSE